MGWASGQVIKAFSTLFNNPHNTPNSPIPGCLTHKFVLPFSILYFSFEFILVRNGRLTKIFEQKMKLMRIQYIYFYNLII